MPLRLVQRETERNCQTLKCTAVKEIYLFRWMGLLGTRLCSQGAGANFPRVCARMLAWAPLFCANIRGGRTCDSDREGGRPLLWPRAAVARFSCRSALTQFCAESLLRRVRALFVWCVRACRRRKVRCVSWPACPDVAPNSPLHYAVQFHCIFLL